MTIEQLIIENTNALKDNNLAVHNLMLVQMEFLKLNGYRIADNVLIPPQHMVPTPPPVAQPATPRPSPEADEPMVPIEVAANNVVKAPAPIPAAPIPQPEVQAQAPISYEQVYNALLNVAKTKNRDAVKGILTTFGVQNGSQLKPEQYTAVLAACNAVLGVN